MSGIPVRFLNGTGDQSPSIKGLGDVYISQKTTPAVKRAAQEAVIAVNKAAIARTEYERAVELAGLQGFSGLGNLLDNLKAKKEKLEAEAQKKIDDAKKLAEKSKNAVKDSINEAGKYSAAQILSHTVNAGNLLPAREALKQVLKYNVFGFASILDYIKRVSASKYKEVQTIWFVNGGDGGNLDMFINEGATKVPRQVAPAILNRIPKIKGLIEKANRVYYEKTGKVPTNPMDGFGGLGEAEAAPHVLTSAEITIAIITATTGLIAAIAPMVADKKDKNDDDFPKNDFIPDLKPDNKKSSSGWLIGLLGVVAVGTFAFMSGGKKKPTLNGVAKRKAAKKAVIVIR